MTQPSDSATGPAVALHRSDTLFGTEYAYAASVAPGSRLIFLAGSCPLDPAGATVGVGDFAAQAVQCLENLRSVLQDAGAGLADIVSTRILVASSDRADLGAVWSVVREAFGDHDVPSTLLGVTVLGYEDQLVEIEAVAAVRDPA
ncbi:RidA family protein [Frondihabitans peucedani]|uniref:RidA family protein n=1 Tax=Frondihabitans peucedani TaxID=598626 RepID=UPI0031D022D8